jgi:hypothetical protein
VDVSDNDRDVSLVVTIHNSRLYLDFWCSDWKELRSASEFLRSAPVDGSLKVGSFCDVLSVELDCFRREPGAVYLSVTKEDDQSMAYCLRDEDREHLASALSSVADAARKQSGDNA